MQALAGVSGSPVLKFSYYNKELYNVLYTHILVIQFRFLDSNKGFRRARMALNPKQYTPLGAPDLVYPWVLTFHDMPSHFHLLGGIVAHKGMCYIWGLCRN